MSKVEQEFRDLILAAFEKEIIKKLVFSRPEGDGYKKISGRLCAHRGQKFLALEATVGDTVKQKNLRIGELAGELDGLITSYGQINLLTTMGDAEYKRNKKGEPIVLGLDKLSRKMSGAQPVFEKAIEELDRRKNYILDGKEEFLIKLGISSKDGRVHDKKQGKFRQINKFLEYTEDIYKELPEEGELTVFDLCCGKSYLSFALYYYLTAIKGRNVYMLGADLKSDVIAFCDHTAKELGFTGMTFLSTDIRTIPTERVPHLVISLHACDIATDIVLETAIRLGAKVILSTPCCHKNLSDKINSPELEFVTKYPKLKGKLCEAITDALRLELLSANGYSAIATELVDPEDTPKNTLLRAVLRSTADERKIKKYKELLAFLMREKSENYLPFTE